jgi:hypothetical protein
MTPSQRDRRIAYTEFAVADVWAVDRIRAGRAYCALCGTAIGSDDDALLTPDFIADELEPLWRFADAAMHRTCFLVWDRRKAFIARYNRLARRWAAPDGSRWRMTSEGDIVREEPQPLRGVASAARHGSHDQ